MMAQQTSVDFLWRWWNNNPFASYEQGLEAYRQAKEIHHQEITKTAIQCHFQGVRQQAKNSEEYLDYGEQHYNELFKTK